MKFLVFVLSFLCTVMPVMAQDGPMVIKITPIVVGDLYPDPDDFFEILLEVPGFAFSEDAQVELKTTKVVRERRSAYKDVSQEEIDQLLDGNSSIESQIVYWARNSVPVMFVDSVGGKIPTEEEIEVFGRNGRLIVSLGESFTEEWLSVIAHKIGHSLGLEDSDIEGNLMNLGFISWAGLLTNSQVSELRDEVIRLEVANIPSMRPKKIDHPVRVGEKKIVFYPENLVDGVVYRWQASVDLETWETLDPRWWNPSSGQYLGTGSAKRAFYKIQVISVYERYLEED